MELSIFETDERCSVELFGDADELDIRGDECSLAEPVRVTCRLFRDVALFRIEGKVFARLAVQCARCLEPFVKESSGEFTLVVKHMPIGEPVPGTPQHAGRSSARRAHVEDPAQSTRSEPFSGADRGEEADGEQIMYIEHHVTSVDITAHVRDAVILSLPMKILCREDCRGLCPVCGRNLNEGGCGCRYPEAGATRDGDTAVQSGDDPRWRALADKFGEKGKK